MSTISAGTTNVNSFIVNTDTTGNLVLQSGSSLATALTLDSSQNATFTGNVSVRTSGGVYTDVANGVAKAWVNFNGTSTVAIRSSFNVSSITDNGTGDYTVNFTTAMPNTNYATLVSCTTDATSPTYSNLQGTTGAATTSLVKLSINNSSPTSADRTTVCVAIFSL